MINSAIKKILSDYTHRPVISLDGNLTTDLEMDCWSVLDVLTIIDQEFDINLGNDPNTPIMTVRDLCNGTSKLIRFKNNSLH